VRHKEQPPMANPTGYVAGGRRREARDWRWLK
jgi:hypothetical protein